MRFLSHIGIIALSVLTVLYISGHRFVPVVVQFLIFASFATIFYYVFNLIDFLRTRRAYQMSTAREVEMRQLTGTMGFLKPYLTLATNVFRDSPFLKRFYVNASNRYMRLLEEAGNPGTLTSHEYITFKILIFVATLVLFVLFLAIIGKKFLMIGMAMVLISLILPDMVLKRTVANRQSQIKQLFPNAVDELVLMMKAGVGFDQSIDIFLSNDIKDPIKEEFYEARAEMRLGRPRSEAMASLADRVGVDEVRTFATTVIQSETTGVSITDVLTQQSEITRERYFQKIEEQGQKAPMKMLFPLMVFVMPCIFLIIFTPIIVNYLSTQ